MFVEDTALILGEHAVITRPGAPSRAGRNRLDRRWPRRAFRAAPDQTGHLDGGDVLRIGRTLYVGVSTRTDLAGIAALARIANPLGYEVIAAQAGACLHLKTGATFAGDESALQSAGDRPGTICGSRAARRRRAEPDAANCVRAGDRLILPAGNPRTAERLRGRGFDVVEVDVSELQKAEAGVTCMSLIDERS